MVVPGEFGSDLHFSLAHLSSQVRCFDSCSDPCHQQGLLVPQLKLAVVVMRKLSPSNAVISATFILPPAMSHTIGALIMRIGFWGPVYYNYNKEPPRRYR